MGGSFKHFNEGVNPNEGFRQIRYCIMSLGTLYIEKGGEEIVEGVKVATDLLHQGCDDKIFIDCVEVRNIFKIMIETYCDNHNLDYIAITNDEYDEVINEVNTIINNI